MFIFILGLGPICDEIRTWASNLVRFYFIESLSRFCISCVLCVYFVFFIKSRVSYFMLINVMFRVFNTCCSCLNVFSANCVVLYCSMSLVLIFVYVKCHFIFNNCVFKLFVFRILNVLRIRSYFILFHV